MEKVITGEWDGMPIWRRKTAGEILAEELVKEELAKRMHTDEETV